MHELGLTQEIVSVVSEKARALRENARVTSLCLEIGKVSGVLPDAVEFCFELCCENTPLEGARLVINLVDGQVRCLKCQRVFILNVPYGECECGSFELDWLKGHEFKIKQMEIV